jgi:hypothetical protein
LFNVYTCLKIAERYFLPVSSSKKEKKPGTLEHIVEQHEECLRRLSSSNLMLAQSVLELATKLKTKRPVSAALQFKF